MPDTELRDRLERLAPTVDPIASRALFERSRARGATPRWLLPAAVVMLLVAGVVGLWAVARDDDAPARPADEGRAPVTDGSVTAGDGYETIIVTETGEPFGDAWLVEDSGTYDEIMNPLPDLPAVDFSRVVVLVMTRPDNACADTIVRFDVETVDGTPTWTPVFQGLSSACNDPLLSWLYVVVIDRSLLGSAANIRVPAAEVYGVAEVLLRYESTGAPVPDGTSPDGTSPDGTSAEEYRLTETGIRLPIPPAGEPALHSTTAGLLWVVAHDGGDVSVLPGTFPLPADQDEGGVRNLHALVLASESGRTFATAGLLWDDHGRAISGGRVNDLVGFEGRVVDGEVEVLDSGATRIDGSPAAPVTNEDYPIPELPPMIDIPTFMTLSSSGPIWRHLDATLVVEDGIGRICDISARIAVPDLPTCGDAEFVLDTAITSSQPDITSWFHPPILAFQDPTRGFTFVVPLGGMSSRNDAAFDDPVASVTDIRFRCDERAGLVIQVDLEIAGSGSAELIVIDGDTELGTTVTSGSGAWSVGFPLATEPGPGAELRVSSSWSDVSLDLPTDVPTCRAPDG